MRKKFAPPGDASTGAAEKPAVSIGPKSRALMAASLEPGDHLENAFPPASGGRGKRTFASEGTPGQVKFR